MDLHLASEIIARARSLADLPNTAHISHNDEIHSINEAWRDIYAFLKDNDDDYYITRADLTISAASAIAGTVNQWLVDLPADCAQIRDLSYQTQVSDWWPVKKFPPSMRELNPNDWHYRLENGKLWIIGGNTGATTGTLRLRYYPAPAEITVPQAPYYYGSSYSLAALRGLTVPAWAALNRTMIYMGASNGIKAESQTLNNLATPVALFSESGAVTNLQYYKGTLFWIRGANIQSKDTALAAALTAPTALTSSNDVICFHIVGDTIYYANATEIRSCTLAGASDALVGAAASVTSLCKLGSIIYYVAGGALKSLSPAATLVASAVSKVTCDDIYLYDLTTAYVLNRLTVSATPAVTATAQLATDVGDIGHAVLDNTAEATGIGQLAEDAPNTWVIPMLTREQQRLVALDVTVDYDFTYPNNLVTEIMAYQCAVDFRTKGDKDASGLAARLGTADDRSNTGKSTLWKRFKDSSIKRDEYQPTRINNAYPTAGRGWY